MFTNLSGIVLFSNSDYLWDPEKEKKMFNKKNMMPKI